LVVAVTPALHTRVVEEAERQNVTLTDYVTVAVLNQLEKDTGTEVPEGEV